MWPYWLLFFIAAWGALAPLRLLRRQANVMWGVVGAFFTILMGLRDHVGGDWVNYLPYFQRASEIGFLQAAALPDPGYNVLNWLVYQLGGDIYGVNLVCAAVVMWGTVSFCKRQPEPWLALLVAVPYMLVVVGMGYTRQSVALGFALLGLVALGKGQVKTFIVWVAIGALFHKSAVLLLPIAALGASRNRLLTGALVAAATLLMYYLLLEQSVQGMWTSYVVADYQSEGGPIRVAMNALPAVLLFIFRQRLVPEPQKLRLWLWIAVFALVCIPLVPLASTAVDRVALYLIPVQMFVFARLPSLAGKGQTRTILVIAVVGYYAAVQFVWLEFAVNARYWLPYHFMPLG